MLRLPSQQTLSSFIDNLVQYFYESTSSLSYNSSNRNPEILLICIYLSCGIINNYILIIEVF